MKTMKLLLASAVAGTLITGCLDLSSDDKEELKAFLDGYAEETNEETSTSAAYEKDYLDSTEVTEADAVGSARIGGEIDAASVENRILSQGAGRSMSKDTIAARALDAIGAGNFMVSFINGKGQKVDVTIGASQVLVNQPASGNPQFIIEGMGDGINYIVDIAVTVDGGEPVNLKTVAFVPPGATRSEKVVLDPISTVVAEAVTEKVKNGFFETGGDTFSQDYIADLKENLTTAVETVIAENPDFTVSDFAAAIDSEDGVDSLVSKLLADEEVSSSVNKLEDAAVAEKFEVPETVDNQDDARARVDDLFEQLFGGDGEGGAPSFIVKFFGDQYAAGELRSINTLFDVIWAGVDLKGQTSYEDEDGNIVQLSKANALAGFTSQLDQIFAAIARIETLEGNGTLTAEEENELAGLYEFMNDVPDLILGIFPPSKADEWLALDGNSQFTVPQAITLIFYMLEDYFADLRTFERDEETGQVEEQDGVDFDPEPLLEEYGFNPDDSTQQGEYASLDVHWLGVHPGRVWINNLAGGQGGEVDVLNVDTCIDAFPEDIFDVSGATLTYPTAAGTNATVDLKSESDFYSDNGGEQHDGGGDCFRIDPWRESDILGQQEAFRDDQDNINWDAVWETLFDNGTLVTDFVSGTYTVTVTYSQDGGAAQTSAFTFEKRIITGLEGLSPVFTSPVGLPPFPQPGASPEEWEAFNEAQANFSITSFPDSDSVFFTWDEPELLATTPLPEGVVAVYNVDIGRDVCTENEGCYWEHIFSSWELGGQIFGTSFELPDDVKERLPALTLADTPYQANINIGFIDEETGEFLGNGGWNGAPFRVGEPLDLNSTFTLTGNVANAPDANQTGSVIADYKVAMVKESCMEDTTQEGFTETFTDENGDEVTKTFFPWVCTSETLAISALTDDGAGGHTYSLTPTLLEAMGNTNNAWIDIRLFIDEDDDDVIDRHDGTAQSMEETQYWSQNGVHFNSWGGVLRINRHDNQTGDYSEIIVIPGETYEGPDFDTDMGGCCGGDGGDHGGDEPANMGMMVTDNATFLDIGFSWDIFQDAGFANADVDEYEVILAEVDAQGEPISALIAHFDNTVSSTTIDDMLNGTNGATNNTATVLAEVNAEDGSSIVELTGATLLESKTYIVFVEAYDAQGNTLGESDDIALDGATP